jgi:hypothetical protein
MRTQVHIIFEPFKETSIKFYNSDLHHLCRYHPYHDKEQIELICGFRVWGGHNLQLFFKDGSLVERFKWKVCIENYLGCYTDEKRDRARFHQIMRAAVENDIETFRQSQEQVTKCTECGVENPEKWHIDHFEIPFIKIKDDFMALHQLKTLEFCYEEKRLVDTQKASEWIEYHKSKAKLRKICATCNMSNHAYGYSNRATPPKKKAVKKAASNVYVQVPYHDRDEAKKLGCRWDNEKKSWYFQDDIDSAKIDLIQQRWSNQRKPSEVFRHVYVQVPFHDKDEAKNLGCKWDNEKRSWYFDSKLEFNKAQVILRKWGR